MKRIISVLALAAAILTLPLCVSVAQDVVTGAMALDDDAKYAKDLIKPGKVMPDFTLNTLDGKAVKLSSYRGHYVVLDFWASWCPDCRRDIPNVKRMYKAFADKGVVFIGVSFDDNKEALSKAVKDLGIEYTQVSELKKWKSTDTSKKYKVNWIPTMYLVGPDGKVVVSTVMSEKVEKELTKVFPACAE